MDGRKITCGVLCLGVLGVAGYYGYKTYHRTKDYSESTTDAGMPVNGGYIPPLPIHPKSQPNGQEAVFANAKKVTSNYKGVMVPARSTDYVNPSQFVPSTGPGNLAPLASDGFMADEISDRVPPNPHAVTSGGPYPGNGGIAGNFNSDHIGIVPDDVLYVGVN